MAIDPRSPLYRAASHATGSSILEGALQPSLVNQTYLADQHRRLVADIDTWMNSGTDMSLDAYLIEAGWRKG